MLKLIFSLVIANNISTKNFMRFLFNILTMTLMVSTISLFYLFNYWLTIQLLFIYSSGILVLFLFMTTFLPNEKITKNSLKMIFLVVLLNMLKTFNPPTAFSNTYTKILPVFENNKMLIFAIILFIVMTAYFPTTMLNSFIKSMKSSK